MREPFNFKKNVTEALADKELRANFRKAMGGFILKRKALLSDEKQTEELRDVCNSIRRRALARLPQLLEQLEANCTKNGITVHWAETAEEANAIILNLIKEKDAQKIVKGKSMVSEEMHLNHYLENHGMEVAETDLGEFIIQLNHETPSHIIVPAVHKNKRQVAEIFHKNIPDVPYTEEVEELNAIARATLRKKYQEGEIGLSGVNMAVAETGTLCLVENEGNGRMCTTVPPVHIAVMGIEKVVEKLQDVPPILRMLTASATGQIITTYFNMITSPRKKGERDGPHEVHLVLLDNGRSQMLADPLLRQTLQCIRCGTCLNHCPVYTRIGGHAYGHVYPGPIGKILTPQMEGLERAGALTLASSLCDACAEVCPVKIPIPDILRRLRNEMYGNEPDGAVRGSGARKSCAEAMVWKGWKLVYTKPFLNRWMIKAAGLVGDRLPKTGPLKAWTSVRTAPRAACKSLHEMAKEEGVRNE